MTVTFTKSSSGFHEASSVTQLHMCDDNERDKNTTAQHFIRGRRLCVL